MSITKTVEEYISKSPSIKYCLKKDLVNFSSLSRIILEELGLGKKNFDAVLVACRRYKDKIRSGYSEKNIINVLKSSRVEIKNKVVAFVLEKNVLLSNIIELEKDAKRKSELFYIVEGSSAVIIISVEDFYDKIKKITKNKIIKNHKGLALITIKSPREIETTPGIVAYLYSLFAENGVNIIETFSCWKDTLFVIAEDDIKKVIDIFKF